MNCIFCKKNSDNSTSVEHIIPESLGNKKHILPKGIVCDQCNSYFAIKIENQLLSQEYFKFIRSAQGVLSKKRRVIPSTGFIVHPEGGNVEIYREPSGVFIDIPKSEIVDLIVKGRVNKLYIPHHIEPVLENVPLSRLLGKMAIEALTQKILNVDGWETEIIDKAELEPLRSYVRYGPAKIKLWHYSQRILYPPDFTFIAENGETYEVLHEYTFHYSDANELFFVIAIFGIEYAINLAGPEIDTYQALIRNNNGKSFLYC
ncbi:HNH endonuclease [Chitinophaga oryziterrae]|uniref:HNH endonuclease n=1 Tax=Chitinophaga oryziterrae TaxID=1031224 RepID=A0A6N8JI05_9BACT|nr:HNH endonuclease [Chitinophaga oryziterrae]MVT44847.1 HNH endonuclease [Chitinophaga oryziterrae]